jgi:hypothetical protein
MGACVDPNGNSRDLGAEQARFAQRGWKFKVRYLADEPTYLATARKSWALNSFSVDEDTHDKALALLLDLMSRTLASDD